MNRHILLFATALLVAFVPATTFAQNDADAKAIREVIQRYEKALNAADVEAVVKLYTDDGVVMSANNPPGVGRDTIRAIYDGLFKAVKLDIKFEIDEAMPLSGQWAVARSHSKFTVKVLGTQLPPQPDANHELYVLHKEADGHWRIARYSFASSEPAPKPTPAGK